MNDSHWDVNGDGKLTVTCQGFIDNTLTIDTTDTEGFDDPMIEDTGFATEQDEGWSRRGSRIILGDDHEDEERLSIQAEKIVHKGFFNSTLMTRDALSRKRTTV